MQTFFSFSELNYHEHYMLKVTVLGIYLSRPAYQIRAIIWFSYIIYTQLFLKTSADRHKAVTLRFVQDTRSLHYVVSRSGVRWPSGSCGVLPRAYIHTPLFFPC